jgi:hypothetical protein
VRSSLILIAACDDENDAMDDHCTDPWREFSRSGIHLESGECFTPIQVPGDGMCVYSAVWTSLSKLYPRTSPPVDANPSNLRDRLIAYKQENRRARLVCDNLQNLDDAEAINSILDSVSRRTRTGSNVFIDLVMMTFMLNVDIFVVCQTDPQSILDISSIYTACSVFDDQFPLQTPAMCSVYIHLHDYTNPLRRATVPNLNHFCALIADRPIELSSTEQNRDYRYQ